MGADIRAHTVLLFVLEQLVGALEAFGLSRSI